MSGAPADHAVHVVPQPAGAAGQAAVPALQVRGAQGGYGDLEILHGVDLTLPPACWATIIGANGAGKSTLLKLIAGIVDCRQGTVAHEGHDITRVKPIDRLKAGIGFVPQGRCNFPMLSVRENLELGAYTRRLSQAERRAEIERVTARFPRLRDRAGIMAGNLSGGEQQLLETAMVLMTRPRLLLLDEPSLGLSPAAMELVFDLIRGLVADGITVLMVEQNARQALEACDLGIVLELGRVALVEPASQVLSHPEIRRMFLGL